MSVITTIQYVEIDADPSHPITADLQPEYADLSGTPFIPALVKVIDSPEATNCDSCGRGVGYYLEETDDGRLEHAYWHHTTLVLHPHNQVVVLCEDCASPVCGVYVTPADWFGKEAARVEAMATKRATALSDYARSLLITAPCGDAPAPCNCDDTETHGGH